jgi:hypothetical protein
LWVNTWPISGADCQVRTLLCGSNWSLKSEV